MSCPRRRRSRLPGARWPGLLPGVLVALAVLGAGRAVAGGGRLDPATVAAVLAGRYDNVAQVEAERQAGGEPHQALALAIVPVTAPLVADIVLFVQESAADDPRRVFSQRIWVVGEDARHRVAHGVYRFVEPERWRSGATSPELFRALLVRDLEPVAGCDVRWQRTAGGLRGANDAALCRAGDVGGEARLLEQVYEVDGATLAFSERKFDARGGTPRGGAAPAPYRFRRRGDAVGADRP